MGAALNDIAVLHHQNLVGIFNGGQAVGHDKARAALHQFLKSILYQYLGTGIDAGRCFVQNQDRRAAQHHAGNTKQLALALADIASVLGHLGIIAVGQAADKAVGTCLFGCCDDFFPRGIGLAVGDIFGNGPGFQPGLLQYHA